ncbi:hypothetical protein BCR44DRAFT_1435271 [Catenaria anguillulae PL171]|uniref:Uncharacterized protein n=1 Tax=Catenaria anguillulae PL171 TaxID=765915 RepID=A0A1Y2HP02_9FUNG|nr:hypothetical protein BCR44DRAFT_1435271 [Catenaria anguillulae PL171]
MCTASSLRALSISDFTLLTGAEWHSLACVFPLLLVDFFDGIDSELINMLVVGTFTSFAILMHIARARVITSSMLEELNDELDNFFFLVAEFFNVFDAPVPQALVLHMTNHFDRSTTKFGTTHGTTTALHAELMHKSSVKAPAKRTNGRGSLELSAFNRVIAYDAFCSQFAHLALFHPGLAILRHVEEVRDGARDNDPRCPLVPLESAVHVKSTSRIDGNDAAEETGEVSEDDEADEADTGDGIDENRADTGEKASARPAVPPAGEVRGVDKHCWSIYTKLRAKRGPAYHALEDLEQRFADLKGLKRLFGEYVMTSIEGKKYGSFNAAAVNEALKYRVYNVSPAEKLVIDRWSNLAQAVVEESIFGRVTKFHGHVRRDFAVIDNLNDTYSIFLPRLFIQFDYFSSIEAVYDPKSTPTSYIVAFGQYFTRFMPGGDILLFERSSGVPVLARGRLGVIGLDQFVSAAHLVPYFGALASEEGIDRDNCVEKCAKWLLNVFVDKEAVSQQRSSWFLHRLR